MKLLPIKKRKIAVLFTAGLGDALLFVPLLKALKQKQFIITGIFYSRFDNDCIYDNSLLDEKIHIKSKVQLLLYSIAHFKKFENVYHNHMGIGKLTAFSIKACSKRFTSTNNKGGKRNRTIVDDLTDAEQNLHLLFSTGNSYIRSVDAFCLPQTFLQPSIIKKFVPPGMPYVVIQISAGNNATPYKNWSAERWVNLVAKLCQNYPSINFVISGDHTETRYNRHFSTFPFNNCIELIGKTTVEEIFNLVAGSTGYIGLDSGLMHIAVTLQKKTVTIFGASNEKLYGYAMLDSKNHAVIAASLSCRPCSSWKAPNTTRVTDPLLCPDFACMKAIGVYQVYTTITNHFNW
ncbi:MAG: glycosyltransferase family 9 protein [Bacteroidetes bacterium]|nr:glycosyltransferase family 9 protein [Bacteroidota bacterium]